MCSLYIKFQEKIFTGKKIIQLWNFGNFGIPEIIPKILVTLRFSKISLHELKGNCKCFKMRYWPHFYVDPTHSNTYFSKAGIWRVLLQGTVGGNDRFFLKMALNGVLSTFPENMLELPSTELFQVSGPSVLLFVWGIM